MAKKPEPLTAEQKQLRDEFAADFPNIIRLVMKLFPQAYQAMRFGRGMSIPEIESIAWEGVMNACRGYKPGKGAKFLTYASRCVVRAIMAEYCHSKKQKRRPVEGTKVVNASEDNGKSFHLGILADKRATTVDEHDKAEELNAIRIRVRFALDELANPRWRKVLEMRYGIPEGDQMILNEVGKILGVSRERVRQLEVRAIEELKPKLESLWASI